MSKARVLIVEDEPLIADDIADALERNGYEVVAIADEAEDALQAVADHAPEIALLDVNIEGDTDGIELAHQLSIPFVFLTSYYDQNTLDRAKQTNPAGYIVKPFSEKDLIVNLEIARSRGSFKVEEKRQPEKLFLKNGEEIVSVVTSDIYMAEAYDNYTYIHTEKDKFLISHTLKSIEEKLLPFGFRRIHRSYLINFEKVTTISDKYVFLDTQKAMIGKSYRKEFLESLSLL
ncbi:MAG: LytTR family transcriptional regulator DNA-binding domain-containing protein [Cyclobacteriaceae bacterium]